ncbi:VanZ family protein [Dysgonomonas sp. PH5-45]|uniref:VanZ family protein n=1 Tax=unclassified Dysgonomonas TaxID=2630389 RepID=UPI00247481BF|nr:MULTISPECIES: VanZ family protein [unclassified Dysgonomonas]MDH6355424.1 VanZ family protein [Dysgonomonas sp. PH5-45]MDH6388321.1 VanZ family protein [Dysgonomonas sp. PH5-37]
MFLNLLKYTYVPLLIAALIFYLCCLITVSDIPDVEIDFFIPFDKVAHFFMYFGFSGATALNYIYLKKGDIDVSRLLIWAFLMPILYGALIEVLQDRYFPPRAADWYDFLADGLGALTALPIAIVFRNYILKQTTK